MINTANVLQSVHYPGLSTPLQHPIMNETFCEFIDKMPWHGQGREGQTILQELANPHRCLKEDRFNF